LIKKDFIENTVDFFKSLEKDDRELLLENTFFRKYQKGQIIYGGSECTGLILIISGRIRAYTVGGDGKEITLFRLLEGDKCILSASCMMKDIDFTVSLSFEEDSEVFILPTEFFDNLNQKYPEVKSFTLKLMSGRLSDIMWVLQQFVFSGVAERLKKAIFEQYVLSGGTTLSITHEELAKEIGSAREVVTRLLKQFSEDGIIAMKRGHIEIIDEKMLLD